MLFQPLTPLILPLFLTTTGWCDLYTYTTGDGAVVTVDDISGVPERYRRPVKVTQDERPPAAKPSMKPDTTPANPAEALTAAPPPQRSGGGNILKIVHVVAAVGVVLFATFRLLRFLASPEPARMITLILSSSLVVTCFKLYADHLANGYVTIEDQLIRLHTFQMKRTSSLEQKDQ